MAWNGSGVFTRLYNWVVDRDAGVKILASKMDAEQDGFTTGINACLTKNGENSATGNLPMGTNRHTGVGDAAALTDYASANQVVDNAFAYGGASAAGTDTYAVNLAISPGAYATGARYQMKADVANTGACTVNFNSVGALNIKLQDGSDPLSDAISAGMIADFEYDGTNAVLLNPNVFDGNGGLQYDLHDANGNEVLKRTTTASAVNEFTIVPSATGNDVVIKASGDDTNINIDLQSKGSGSVKLDGASPGAPAMFIATRSTSTDISNGAKIDFDTEVFDPNSEYDNATNYRYIPSISGYYYVTLLVPFSHIAGTSQNQITIKKNGSVVKQSNNVDNNSSTSGGVATLTTILYLNGSTDYIEAFASSSGIDWLSGGTANFNEFSAYLVSTQGP